MNSFVKKMIKSFGGAPAENPDLTSNVNNAQSAQPDASQAPAQEQRDVPSSVTRISVPGGSIGLVVKQGDVPGMKVECSRAGHLGYVTTDVSGNTLTIRCKPATIVSNRGNLGVRISGRGNSVVQINNGLGSIQIGQIGRMVIGNVDGQVISGNVVNTGPVSFTSHVDAKGNVTSTTTGLDNPILESDGLYLATVTVVLPNVSAIDVDGAADVEYHGFNQESLSVDISGSGSVSLSGAVNTFDAEISGAGDIKASNLISKNASLRVSGAGSIKAGVTDKVKARITGAGSVKIYGNPTERDTKVSGAGEIKFK